MPTARTLPNHAIPASQTADFIAVTQQTVAVIPPLRRNQQLLAGSSAIRKRMSPTMFAGQGIHASTYDVGSAATGQLTMGGELRAFQGPEGHSAASDAPNFLQ